MWEWMGIEQAICLDSDSNGLIEFGSSEPEQTKGNQQQHSVN